MATANKKPNVGFTDAGMNTRFTLTGTDSYSFTVDFLNNNGTISSTETFSGTLGGNAGDTIDGFRIFSYNVGNGGQNDFFANSMFISGADVPEPATVLRRSGPDGRRRPAIESPPQTGLHAGHGHVISSAGLRSGSSPSPN